MNKYDKKWQDRYDQLKQYKAKHGNCNVSSHDRINENLGLWVMSQRSAYKNSKLSKERIEKLRSIGFQWCLRY